MAGLSAASPGRVCKNSTGGSHQGLFGTMGIGGPQGP